MNIFYKYLHYIPISYLFINYVRWLNDDAIYIAYCYPILITLSFLLSLILTGILNKRLNNNNNSFVKILLFFSFLSFFTYEVPNITHIFNKNHMSINVKIKQINSYMGGSKHNYRKHYEVTVSSQNNIFNNKKLNALDEQVYSYLRKKDIIELSGYISTFMFRLEKIKVISSPNTIKEQTLLPLPPR